MEPQAPNTAGRQIYLVTGQMQGLTLLDSLHTCLFFLGGLKERGTQTWEPHTLALTKGSGRMRGATVCSSSDGVPWMLSRGRSCMSFFLDNRGSQKHGRQTPPSQPWVNIS